jgi:hypothetical protein
MAMRVRIPRPDVISCASCGHKIDGNHKKVSTPLKRKYPIRCCPEPDFRECPNPECEGMYFDQPARICRNCGYYYGSITW